MGLHPQPFVFLAFSLYQSFLYSVLKNLADVELLFTDNMTQSKTDFLALSKYRQIIQNKRRVYNELCTSSKENATDVQIVIMDHVDYTSCRKAFSCIPDKVFRHFTSESNFRLTPPRIKREIQTQNYLYNSWTSNDKIYKKTDKWWCARKSIYHGY